MNTIAANGITLRYDVQGSGPWVVLCHSLATDLTLWDDQVGALAARHTVLRFDTRGHGGSSAPDLPYSLDMLAADVLGLLDGLGVERCAFVGISLGGMIGQHLALLAPQRVERLVLASTTSGYPAEARAMWADRIAAVRDNGMAPLVAPTLERWFTPPWRDANPAVMARIGGLIRATPPAGYIGCGHAIAALDTTARLSTISCPTLVVAGSQDMGTPTGMGRTIAENIPGARFELIDPASHLCNLEQAVAFNRLLVDFLS